MGRLYWSWLEGPRDEFGNVVIGGGFFQTTVLPSSVSVGIGTAVPLPANPLSGRKTITIFNNSDNAVIYIGDIAVTTLTGLPLYPHSAFTVGIGSGVQIYAISDTIGADIRVLEGA